MPVTICPHEAFRYDFDILLLQAKQQEDRHPANKGEFALVNRMHRYFAEEVLPLISSDDWIFEATRIFATEYAIECFRHLRIDGSTVFQMQQKLSEIREVVIDLVAKAKMAGAAPKLDDIEEFRLGKFMELILADKLPSEFKREVQELEELAKEHEYLQLEVTIQQLRKEYEVILPRLMFVLRRIIDGNRESIVEEDNSKQLLSVSKSLSWYESQIAIDHPLYPVLGNLRNFYTIARNVASHHEGLKWEPESSEVVLKDRNKPPLVMHVYEFQQKYRYMTYLCELGLRGIMAAFCERERGETSYKLALEYEKTFPSNFPVSERKIVSYPECEAD